MNETSQLRNIEVVRDQIQITLEPFIVARTRRIEENTDPGLRDDLNQAVDHQLEETVEMKPTASVWIV